MHAAPPSAELSERHRVARRSTLVSVLVNVVLTLVQLWIGLQTRSQALVADAIHSLSDLMSDFIVLLANRHSHKAADAGHPYGHQRFETASSLALGLLLIGVGIGMIWRVIPALTPGDAPATVLDPMALYVALFTLACKEGLFRYLLAQAHKVHSSMLVANAWHSRSDAASSLVVALGIAGNMAGYAMLDAVAALIVGLLIVRMGAQFAWNALNDLMDRAASLDHLQRIQAALNDTPDLLGWHDLRTRRMGDLIQVDVHLEVDGDWTVARAHEIALMARQRIMASAPVLDVMTHLDPVRQPTS